MIKSLLRKELDNLLRPMGFTNCGNCFIRVIGDGILQGVWFGKNRFMKNSNCILVFLDSLYADNQGDLINAKKTDSLGRQCSWPVETFESRTNRTKRTRADVAIPENEHLEMLIRTCLPAMDEIDTQKKMCDMKDSWIEFAIIEWKNGWSLHTGRDYDYVIAQQWYLYRDKVIPLMRDGRFEDALEIVNSILDNKYVPVPEYVRKQMLLFQEHITNGDTEFLNQYMENNKKENLEIIQKLFK